MDSSYAQALLDPEQGPLVGIPTFTAIHSQRQRVRAVGSISTSSGALTINVNPRRFVANDSASVRWLAVDGGSAAQWSNANVLYNNAEHGIADFNGGKDLQARVVALRVRVTNVSVLSEQNGVFYALQERHHNNIEAMSSNEMALSENCLVRSAADNSVTMLYRPVQPRETKGWQHHPDGYPDENAHPVCMQVVWKGNAVTVVPGTTYDVVTQYPAYEEVLAVTQSPSYVTENVIKPIPVLAGERDFNAEPSIYIVLQKYTGGSLTYYPSMLLDTNDPTYINVPSYSKTFLRPTTTASIQFINTTQSVFTNHPTRTIQCSYEIYTKTGDWVTIASLVLNQNDENYVYSPYVNSNAYVVYGDFPVGVLSRNCMCTSMRVNAQWSHGVAIAQTARFDMGFYNSTVVNGDSYWDFRSYTETANVQDATLQTTPRSATTEVGLVTQQVTNEGVVVPPQTFNVEVDAIIEYAGALKNGKTDFSQGENPAQPGDIPAISKELERCEHLIC